MSTRDQRIAAAEETLTAFKNGFYLFNGKGVDLKQLHENTMSSNYLYTPSDANNIILNDFIKATKTVYRLSPLPVVACIQELKNNGNNNIGILNFASAKNPGGGFLNGAQAQEESLAMCSNLYLTQIKNQEYYEANRACKSMLYTDYMIYSKDIVFIRDDVNALWQTPITASVLTAPAVNMGQYLAKGNTDKTYAEKVMKDRMRKVLQVFASHKNETLILGAYGCGVFRNDPQVVAKFFIELLIEEGLEKHFKEIVFAVYDSSKTKSVYNAFEKELSAILER